MNATSFRIAVTALVAFVACKSDHDTCGHPAVDVPVVGTLSAPPGKIAARILDGLSRPTMLAFDDRGRLFILEGSPYGGAKAVRIFRQSSALALVEIARVPVNTSGESTGVLPMPDGGGLFVASRGRVDYFAERADGGGFDDTGDAGEAVITNLPNGWHTNNNLRLGPDGRVYFGIGATCDVCTEASDLSATIVRFDPTVRPAVLDVYARGLRNVYDMAFTDVGELVATDNGPECCEPGPDCTGDTPDRVVVVKEGAHYGWPYLHQASGVPASVTVSPWIANTPKHVGITGIAQHQGAALCSERGQLFATYWGTEHAESESGRQVVRVRVTRDGGAIAGATLEPFLGPAGLGHPIALAASPEGALYVLDFQGFLVRVVGLDVNDNGVEDACE